MQEPLVVAPADHLDIPSGKELDPLKKEEQGALAESGITIIVFQRRNDWFAKRVFSL